MSILIRKNLALQARFSNQFFKEIEKGKTMKVADVPLSFLIVKLSYNLAPCQRVPLFHFDQFMAVQVPLPITDGQVIKSIGQHFSFL